MQTGDEFPDLRIRLIDAEYTGLPLDVSRDYQDMIQNLRGNSMMSGGQRTIDESEPGQSMHKAPFSCAISRVLSAEPERSPHLFVVVRECLKIGAGENANRDGRRWPGVAGGKSDSGHQWELGARKVCPRWMNWRVDIQSERDRFVAMDRSSFISTDALPATPKLIPNLLKKEAICLRSRGDQSQTGCFGNVFERSLGGT
jgi:hypothetical protein